MDENFDIIYTNARIDPKEWTTSAVGHTTFNDDALRRTGQAVIEHRRTTRPTYNLITNNCQTYVLQLLDAIQVSTVKQFGTTKDIYKRVFGSGTVAELFVDPATGQQVPAEHPNAMPWCQPQSQPPPTTQDLGVVGGVGGQGQVPYYDQQGMLQLQPPQPTLGPGVATQMPYHSPSQMPHDYTQSYPPTSQGYFPQDAPPPIPQGYNQYPQHPDQGYPSYQDTPPGPMMHQYDQYNPHTGESSQTSVQLAQQVMDANTTQVNAEEMSQRSWDEHDHHDEHEGKEHWRDKAGSFLKKKFHR